MFPRAGNPPAHISELSQSWLPWVCPLLLVGLNRWDRMWIWTLCVLKSCCKLTQPCWQHLYLITYLWDWESSGLCSHRDFVFICNQQYPKSRMCLPMVTLQAHTRFTVVCWDVGLNISFTVGASYAGINSSSWKKGIVIPHHCRVGAPLLWRTAMIYSIFSPNILGWCGNLGDAKPGKQQVLLQSWKGCACKWLSFRWNQYHSSDPLLVWFGWGLEMLWSVVSDFAYCLSDLRAVFIAPQQGQ